MIENCICFLKIKFWFKKNSTIMENYIIAFLEWTTGLPKSTFMLILHQNRRNFFSIIKVLWNGFTIFSAPFTFFRTA